MTDLTGPDVKHGAFRLEHTVRWNPQVPLVRSIRVDPPLTLEEARQVVEGNLSSLSDRDVWSLMDGPQLVRAVDIVSIKIIPVATVPEDAAEGFALTVVA